MYLLPSHTRIFSPRDVTINNYYLISGKGFPALLHNHLKNSIEEVSEIGLFDYLIIVLDSEEETISDRINEVNNFISENGLNLPCNFKILVQHRCIETWLLGNRKVIPRQPSDKKLVELINFYDVSKEDPEFLPKYEGYNTHADFHFNYLKAVLNEKNVHYTKKIPREVYEKYYLNELISRSQSGHIHSFKGFIDFCKSIEKE
jgi:hypothetical protein